jgi:hypothetical protein
VVIFVGYALSFFLSFFLSLRDVPHWALERLVTASYGILNINIALGRVRRRHCEEREGRRKRVFAFFLFLLCFSCL